MSDADVVVGRPMEILLIEDSRADARLTLEALKTGRVKHRLTIVRDGEEATMFLHQEQWFARAPRPDLILLDLNLPLKDGREVLQEVKADYDLAQIPVIVLTASQDHEDELKSQMLNVEGYMQKPVNVRDFIDRVRQLKAYWHADVILP
jgi:CheY-like chemotaxis protein